MAEALRGTDKFGFAGAVRERGQYKAKTQQTKKARSDAAMRTRREVTMESTNSSKTADLAGEIKRKEIKKAKEPQKSRCLRKNTPGDQFRK